MPRRRSSIRQQMLVLGIVATGSIWIGALLQYRQLREQDAYLQEVRANLAASALYSQAVRHTARERGLTNGWLLGAAAAKGPPAPLVQERQTVDAAMRALAAATSRQRTAAAEVRADQEDLAHYRRLIDRHDVPAAAAFASYSRLVANVENMAARTLGEGMRAVNLPYEHVNHINQAVEELAQLRGLTFGVLTGGRLDNGTRLEIDRQLTLYQEYMRLYEQTRPVMARRLEARSLDAIRIERMLATVQTLLAPLTPSTPAMPMPAAEWWTQATAAVEELQGLAERESAQLAEQADGRIARLRSQLSTVVAVLVILGMATLALALVIVGRVVRGLNRLLRGLDNVAVKGNFRTQIALDRSDEFGAIGASVNRLISLASTAMEASERDSQQDPLTRVLNRRGLEEEVGARFARRQDAAPPHSALLLDVDHFKRVNDDFGHPAGDRVLVAVAGLITRYVRPGDVVGRYGGEEFLVVLDQCRLADARKVAESIRGAVARYDFGLDRPVTVSVGVAEGGAGESMDSLIDRADQALYGAKVGGRNQVVAP